MSAEKDFVDQLAKSLTNRFPGSVVYRPHDTYTLGVPDILAWVPSQREPLSPNMSEVIPGFSIAVEAKMLKSYLKDPAQTGQRAAPLLHHEFTGPQISMLRALHDAGVRALGIVRVTSEAAFVLDPGSIPASGNFTHEELLRAGRLIHRGKTGWVFW